LRLIEKGEKMKNFRISAVLLALVLIAGSVCAQPPKPATSKNATLADVDLVRSDLRRVEDGLSGRIRTLENKPAGGDTRALEAKIRDLETRVRGLETKSSDLLNRVDRLEKPPVRR